MLSVSLTNYRDLYFMYKNLIQISGKPSFPTLHQLLLELKANAGSVPISLGGGDHDFIGIILPAPTYATIAPMTSFIIPVYPGMPTVAEGTT